MPSNPTNHPTLFVQIYAFNRQIPHQQTSYQGHGFTNQASHRSHATDDDRSRSPLTAVREVANRRVSAPIVLFAPDRCFGDQILAKAILDDRHSSSVTVESPFACAGKAITFLEKAGAILRRKRAEHPQSAQTTEPQEANQEWCMERLPCLFTWGQDTSFFFRRHRV